MRCQRPHLSEGQNFCEGFKAPLLVCLSLPFYEVRFPCYRWVNLRFTKVSNHIVGIVCMPLTSKKVPKPQGYSPSTRCRAMDERTDTTRMRGAGDIRQWEALTWSHGTRRMKCVYVKHCFHPLAEHERSFVIIGILNKYIQWLANYWSYSRMF